MSKINNKKYFLIYLCVLGAIVRFLYGYLFQPWNQNSDHLAWEILLNEGTFRYDQLIHYPHEGGSILIGLLSRGVKFFTDFNSLTITAFMLDFSVRWIQLKVVEKVLNFKVALLFGAWMIFAAPTLVPWGSINFGLHALSSVFPFILVYLLSRNKNTKQEQLIGGVFLGLACWFSYINIVLIPVFFIYQLVNNVNYKKSIYAVYSLLTILILHLMVRYFADPGFHLEEMEMTSVRGVQFTLFDLKTWLKIPLTLSALANAGTVHFGGAVTTLIVKVMFLLLLLIGGVGFIRSKGDFKKPIVLGGLIILFFLIIYAISPFFSHSITGDFVTYRHLSYILPLVSLYLIIGLLTLKRSTVLLSCLMFISVYCTTALFINRQANPGELAIKPAGWTLGKKLGHNPDRLMHIISTCNQDKGLLLEGVGWGMSTTLFEGVESDSEIAGQQLEKLIYLINQFPEEVQETLMRGVTLSFNDEITPNLDRRILERILELRLMESEIIKQVPNVLRYG